MRVRSYATALAVAVLTIPAGTAQAHFTGEHMVAACGPMTVQDAPMPKRVGVRIVPSDCVAVVNSRVRMDEANRCTMLIHARMWLSGRGWLPVLHVSKRCLDPWERKLRPDPAPSRRQRS